MSQKFFALIAPLALASCQKKPSPSTQSAQNQPPTQNATSQAQSKLSTKLGGFQPGSKIIVKGGSVTLQLDNASWEVVNDTNHIIAVTNNPLDSITYTGFQPTQHQTLPTAPFAGLLIKEFVNGGSHSDFIEISLPTDLNHVDVLLHGPDHFEPLDPQHPSLDRRYRNGRAACASYDCDEAVIHHVEIYRVANGRAEKDSEATCPSGVKCDITFTAPDQP